MCGLRKLDVRFEDESVWLSQRLMAELFQKDVRTISEHIQNVYDEGELVPEATIRKFRIVQAEGKRDVSRMVDFYNLDINDRDILNHAGNISHEMAKQLADNVYENFHTKRRSDLAISLSDFDKAVKQIETPSIKNQRKPSLCADKTEDLNEAE